MKRNLLFGVIAMLIAFPTLFAAGYDLTLYSTTAPPAANVMGNGSSAPGFGVSSWASDATGVGSKSEIYIPVNLLFSSAVTIGDISSISYWTNKSGGSGDPDWTFYLYTALQASGNEASWYHTRLNSEPYFTNTPAANDPANAWHQWSTNASSNPMRFYDAGRNGGLYGSYTDPTLADLQGGSINWHDYYSGYASNTVNYGRENLSLISLQTGSAWGNGFSGLVDGVTMTRKNGDVARVNLEAVPEPSSIVLFVSMIGCVGMVIRRRQARA